MKKVNIRLEAPVERMSFHYQEKRDPSGKVISRTFLRAEVKERAPVNTWGAYSKDYYIYEEGEKPCFLSPGISQKLEFLKRTGMM